MLWSLHRFPESLMRDRMQLKDVLIKLKDNKAEIEVTESQLREEALGTNTFNMAEIEED